MLPRLLKWLAKIPDRRNPLLIRHKLTVLLLYGILMFVFQMASRREANREMSLPMFLQNLQLLFPELESLPPADTLNRLLATIEGNHIHEILLTLLHHLIRPQKFPPYPMSHVSPTPLCS